MEKLLPKGWVETKLGDVTTKPQYGWTTKSNNVGKYRYLRTTDIGKGSIDWHKVPFCQELPDDIEKYLLKENDILISRAGSIGLSHLVDGKIENSLFASYLIRFKPFIVPKFISYYLNSKDYWRTISDNAVGIAVQNINAPKLQAIPFPLPPLAEQERIVAKLDKLFAQHEKIKKALDRIPQLLKTFRQQVLTQAVIGKLTEQWREGKELGELKVAKLSDICSLKAGKFVPASEIRLEKEDNLFPCYGGNGLRGYVNSYTHIGSHSLIGRQGALCGNVHFVTGQFHATEHAIVVTADLGIDNVWLFYKLTSMQLNNYAKGVAQPGLSVMNLNPINIEVPTEEEQQEIVRRVESLFAKADVIEERYKILKEKIEHLPQAILHKAFKGELVPQLPTDGDAKDLLAEIMALKTEAKGKRNKT